MTGLKQNSIGGKLDVQMPSTSTTITDGATNTNTTINSTAQAQFNALTDIGVPVAGPNIPANTYISGVTSPTQATISNPATGTGTALTFTLYRDQVMQSAALAAVQAVGSGPSTPTAGAFATSLEVTLDEDGYPGTPEVVWITYHQAGATWAQVVRGQEGTTESLHTQGADWSHGATVNDFGGWEATNIVAASGTALTLPDPALFPANRVLLTGNCVLTFPTPAVGKSFTLALQQDMVGGHTVTWPGVEFGGQDGVAAPIDVPAAGVSLIVPFQASAAGTIGWIGFATSTQSPVAGEFVRCGLVAGDMAAGSAPTTLALGSIPWVTDINSGQAFVDYPVATFPAHQASGVPAPIFPFQLASPVALVSGTSYTVITVIVNAAKTGYGSTILHGAADNVASTPPLTGSVTALAHTPGMRDNGAGAWQGPFVNTFYNWNLFSPGSLVKWAGGVAPSLSATPGKTDVFSFLCADGTNWLGFVAGQNF